MYDPTKPYKHQILKHIEETWKTPYLTVERGLYPVFKKRFTGWEVQHTDGIGTKGLYHWKKRTFAAAAQDALAMNLNDLAMVGATPYAIQNHIVLPKDDHAAILDIVSALAKECRKRRIAMTGGETSIHSDVSGMDISITVSAFIKKRRTNECRVGDVLIGLPSSGIHSNGITLVRKTYGNTIRGAFTEPTRIYLEDILTLLEGHTAHGMMHITGGAFSKLKDILHGTDAVISESPKRMPAVFKDMHARGLSNKILFTTMNCGVGYVLSVPKGEAAAILKTHRDWFLLGEVRKGTGKVSVASFFDGRSVVL